MKNAAYISIGCLIVFTFLNFFVSPMSNFDLCAIYRDVDPSHLRYDITLNWKDQAIKIESLSYSEYQNYQMLSDNNMLYFDGQYLFEVPPTDKKGTLGKIIRVENNAEILRSSFYVFSRVGLYLSMLVGGFFIFCWVDSIFDPIDEYDYE